MKIVYKDMTIEVHAGWGGLEGIDVDCRNFRVTGMNAEQFAAMVYPAISAMATEPPGGTVKEIP